MPEIESISVPDSATAQKLRPQAELLAPTLSLADRTIAEVPLLTGQKTLTLDELAYCLAPRTFRLWELTAEQLAKLPVPRNDGRMSINEVLDWQPGGSV